MTGLYDGIGQLIALYLILLLVIPVVAVLIAMQMKPIKLLPDVKRYLLYLFIYLLVAGITLLEIRIFNRMWHFQLLAGMGIIAGTYLLLNLIPDNNK